MGTYFVTYDFADQLSGIEHAQLKRMKVFKNKADDAKIVTLAYNRFLARSLNINKISNNNFINMYDFLQNTLEYELDNQHYQVTVDDILTDGESSMTNGDGVLNISLDNRLTKKIHLMYNPRFEGQIDFIEYFDANEFKIHSDYYDIRGFLSMSDIFGQRGGVAREVNFDLDGNAVLESLYKRESDGNIRATVWNVMDKGRVLKSFYTKEDLQAYFFDRLNTKAGGEQIFISDRASKTDMGLIKMKTTRKLFSFWHSNFVKDGDNPLTDKPYDTLLDEMKYADKIDGLIAATQAEVNDLVARVEGKLPVFQMNSGLVEKRPFSPYTRRKPQHIVTVARLSNEKRLDLGIKMFALVHDSLPEATWSIYGYSQNNNRQKLQELINKLGLTDFVQLMPYQNDLSKVYEQAKLFWMTSQNEGFNMSQLEAMSYGVPVIAFDINYGPADLIENGFNGYKVEDGNQEMFVEKTITLLQNNRTQLGKNAQKISKKYNESVMWNQWEAISAE